MRSDIVKKGSTRAAHRALFHAMGYTDEDLQKPLIGVVNAFNEIIPGHIHLRQIAEAVKLGIAAAGGTPIEFPAIGWPVVNLFVIPLRPLQTVMLLTVWS